VEVVGFLWWEEEEGVMVGVFGRVDLT
jgi:hypothetical protein